MGWQEQKILNQMAELYDKHQGNVLAFLLSKPKYITYEIYVKKASQPYEKSVSVNSTELFYRGRPVILNNHDATAVMPGVCAVQRLA